VMDLDTERLIRILGGACWSLSLGACAKPSLHKWLSEPVPGDIVLEMSTGEHRPPQGKANCADRLGVLLCVKKVRFPAGPECPDEDLGSREVWYIETFDGRLIWWENCKFIKVIEDEMEVASWNPVRERIDRSEWVASALARHADELAKQSRAWVGGER